LRKLTYSRVGSLADPFDDVGHGRYSGTPNLILKSIPLGRWKSLGTAINIQNKAVRQYKDSELSVISCHAGDRCKWSAQAP
jgi:hypothetical protein